MVVQFCTNAQKGDAGIYPDCLDYESDLLAPVTCILCLYIAAHFVLHVVRNKWERNTDVVKGLENHNFFLSQLEAKVRTF